MCPARARQRNVNKWHCSRMDIDCIAIQSAGAGRSHQSNKQPTCSLAFPPSQRALIARGYASCRGIRPEDVAKWAPVDAMNRHSLAPPSAAIVETIVRFAALDGYMLGGTLYCRPELAKPSTVILFSCGGAVPAVRYARFVRHLAATGSRYLPMITVVSALPDRAQLRGFNALAEDWSELDCGGAIAYLRLRYP